MLTGEDIKCPDCGMLAPGPYCHSGCYARDHQTKPDKGLVAVTLGDGVEFHMTDDRMYLTVPKRIGTFSSVIDLGRPTEKNFDRLISNMKRLRIHTTEREE